MTVGTRGLKMDNAGQIDRSIDERRKRLREFKRFACSDHEMPVEGCAGCYERWEAINYGGAIATTLRHRIGNALVRLKYWLLFWLED